MNPYVAEEKSFPSELDMKQNSFFCQCYGEAAHFLCLLAPSEGGQGTLDLTLLTTLVQCCKQGWISNQVCRLKWCQNWSVCRETAQQQQQQQPVGTPRPPWTQTSTWCMTSPPLLRSIELPLPSPSFSTSLELSMTFMLPLRKDRETRKFPRSIPLPSVRRAGVTGRRGCYSFHTRPAPSWIYGFCVFNQKHWFSSSIISRQSNSSQCSDEHAPEVSLLMIHPRSVIIIGCLPHSQGGIVL